METQSLKISVWMAVSMGIFLPLAETLRRSNQLLDPARFLNWFDDYLLGGAMLAAVYLVRKKKRNAISFLIAAWGIGVGALLLSFLGQFEYYNTAGGDPGIFSTTFVAVVKALILLYMLIGLYFGIKSNEAGAADHITRTTICLMLLCAATATFPIEAAGQRAQTRKPNILFLFADDMRADTIAAHGNPHIKTPNLDGLVRSGFSFRGNYILGGNSGAVCVPSRAMLMSGKSWFKVDTPALNGARLMPEHLGENGYATFATGKWHNGQPSWLRAFQRGKAIMFGGMSDHTKVPVRDLGPDGKLTEVRTGEKFSSEMFADAAIEFLQGHDGRKPFFAYVAFTAPHDPRQPPPAYREMYYRSLPPLPANFLPQLPFDNGMMNGGRDENLGAWPRTEKMIRDQLAEYYGLITHMDEQIGRILAALEKSGQADNTIVIFAADNGLALGSHGLLGKQSVFEHSMRTPLIISGPGIPRGKSTRAFTYLLDIFPTFCDVIGIAPPSDLEGESLRPLWEGRKARVRDSVFLPYIQIQRAVRDERWKLIAYPKIGHLQLFDLQTDPHEMTNLIDHPQSAKHVARLMKLMKQWQARVGDTLEMPTENKPPPKIDLTGQPRKPDQWQPDWIVKKYFGDSQ